MCDNYMLSSDFCLIIDKNLSLGISDAIAKSVLEDLPLDDIFPDLDEHMLETAVSDNHVFQLVKKVTKSYCKVRMYHYGREYTEKMTEEKVRKRLTKLIHFKNQ